MTLDTILENTYVTYPRFPKPGSGLVVPHEVKGITVYLTLGQSRLIHWIVWVLVLSSAVVAINLIINAILYGRAGFEDKRGNHRS